MTFAMMKRLANEGDELENRVENHFGGSGDWSDNDESELTAKERIARKRKEMMARKKETRERRKKEKMAANCAKHLSKLGNLTEELEKIMRSELRLDGVTFIVGTNLLNPKEVFNVHFGDHLIKEEKKGNGLRSNIGAIMRALIGNEKFWEISNKTIGLSNNFVAFKLSKASLQDDDFQQGMDDFIWEENFNCLSKGKQCNIYLKLDDQVLSPLSPLDADDLDNSVQLMEESICLDSSEDNESWTMISTQDQENDETMSVEPEPEQSRWFRLQNCFRGFK